VKWNQIPITMTFDNIPADYQTQISLPGYSLAVCRRLNNPKYDRRKLGQFDPIVRDRKDNVIAFPLCSDMNQGAFCSICMCYGAILNAREHREHNVGRLVVAMRHSAAVCTIHRIRYL
jgi:hypothetical protein